MNLSRNLFVAGWGRISIQACIRTACGGENTGDYFTSISTLTQCTSTYLFKNERSILFWVDYLSHLTTSSTTLNSKHRAWSTTFRGARALTNDLETSTFAAIVMKTAYGIDVQESDDPYIMVAEEAVNGAKQAASPGAFWVDLLPILSWKTLQRQLVILNRILSSRSL